MIFWSLLDDDRRPSPSSLGVACFDLVRADGEGPGEAALGRGRADGRAVDQPGHGGRTTGDSAERERLELAPQGRVDAVSRAGWRIGDGKSAWVRSAFAPVGLPAFAKATAD